MVYVKGLIIGASTLMLMCSAHGCTHHQRCNGHDWEYDLDSCGLRTRERSMGHNQQWSSGSDHGVNYAICVHGWS